MRLPNQPSPVAPTCHTLKAYARKVPRKAEVSTSAAISPNPNQPAGKRERSMRCRVCPPSWVGNGFRSSGDTHGRILISKSRAPLALYPTASGSMPMRTPLHTPTPTRHWLMVPSHMQLQAPRPGSHPPVTYIASSPPMCSSASPPSPDMDTRRSPP